MGDRYTSHERAAYCYAPTPRPMKSPGTPTPGLILLTSCFALLAGCGVRPTPEAEDITIIPDESITVEEGRDIVQIFNCEGIINDWHLSSMPSTFIEALEDEDLYRAVRNAVEEEHLEAGESLRLSAPPGTNVVYTIIWTDTQFTGTAIYEGRNGPQEWHYSFLIRSDYRVDGRQNLDC